MLNVDLDVELMDIYRVIEYWIQIGLEFKFGQVD